jgi:hypothetical protein
VCLNGWRVGSTADVSDCHPAGLIHVLRDIWIWGCNRLMDSKLCSYGADFHVSTAFVSVNSQKPNAGDALTVGSVYPRGPHVI